jgi:hypothetical protein
VPVQGYTLPYQEEMNYPEDEGSKFLFKTLKNYPST